MKEDPGDIVVTADAVHLMPVFERSHVGHLDCWCRPLVQGRCPLSGMTYVRSLVVHRLD